MESIVLESESSVVSTNEKLGYVNHSSTNSAVVDNNSTVFITLANTETVLVENTESQIILAGVMGPPGKDGISEENMVYSKRIDFIDDNTMYKGEALPGSSDTSPVWRISKVVIASDSDVTITWATGAADFDKVWANRQTYIYM